MNEKLWFDDIRRPPDDTWDWARTVQEAKDLVHARAMLGKVYSEASLDHDMGLHGYDPDEPDADLRVAPDRWDYEDGMTFVRWLCGATAYAKERRGFSVVPKVITVHSWNHPAAERMGSYLRQWAMAHDKMISVTVRAFDPAIRRA